jgi:hypothetical protein
MSSHSQTSYEKLYLFSHSAVAEPCLIIAAGHGKARPVLHLAQVADLQAEAAGLQAEADLRPGRGRPQPDMLLTSESETCPRCKISVPIKLWSCVLVVLLTQEPTVHELRTLKTKSVQEK